MLVELKDNTVGSKRLKRRVDGLMPRILLARVLPLPRGKIALRGLKPLAWNFHGNKHISLN